MNSLRKIGYKHISEITTNDLRVRYKSAEYAGNLGMIVGIGASCLGSKDLGREIIFSSWIPLIGSKFYEAEFNRREDREE